MSGVPFAAEGDLTGDCWVGSGCRDLSSGFMGFCFGIAGEWFGGGEPRSTRVAFEDTVFYVSRYTCVERLRAVGHYVNVIEAGRGLHRSFVGRPSLSRGPALPQDDSGWRFYL